MNCSAICKNGITCRNKAKAQLLFCGRHINKEPKGEETICTVADKYTKETLISHFSLHKEYIEKLKIIEKDKNIKFRLPCIPEDISENMIKFIIRKLGDTTCTWDCKGDLWSNVDKKIECKCFTSKGPISFTPSSGWNEIYFFDATEWLNDKFILYKTKLNYDSQEWKNISVNKKETFGDQAKSGRRPRIGWSYLYPQIQDYTEKVFEGSFESIVA